MDPSEETEGGLSVWRRRALSVPGLLLLTLLGGLLTPLALALLGLRDLVRRDLRFPGPRFWLALGLNLGMHSAALFWLIVARSPEAAYRVEATMSRAILWGLQRLFGMELEVEGLDALEGGPALLLARHASVLDPILVLAVTAPAGERVRWVAKRELLWDPCIDILGHRFPTAFVWRKGRAPKRDLEAVKRLADHLEPRGAVLLFPEGTRFSEDKKARAVARLERKDPALAARGRALKHVLPPHPGGVLALLHKDHSDDVVVFAHTGLEGLSHIKDFINGAVIGETLRIKLWRIPRDQIPDDPDAEVEWLWSLMESIDAWLDENEAQ